MGASGRRRGWGVGGRGRRVCRETAHAARVFSSVYKCFHGMMAAYLTESTDSTILGRLHLRSAVEINRRRSLLETKLQFVRIKINL